MSTATLSQPTAQTFEITITRIIDAAPQKVFEAWLCSDALSTWWGPRDEGRDWSTPYVENDPKPGGSYRICIRSLTGEDHWAGGIYREIDKPHRLVLTHSWENPKGHTRDERTITVKFADTGGKTRMNFSIEGYTSSESRDTEIEGWTECMDRLVQYFNQSNHIAINEAEIRQTVDDWSKALEAKDADGLAAAHSQDMVLFDAIPPFQIKGVEAYRTMWKHCLPHFPSQFKCERRGLKIAVNGDVAFLHCLHHIKPIGEESPAGQTWVRVTACYRKIDGKWVAVHEHVSIPFDVMENKLSNITDADVADEPA